MNLSRWVAVALMQHTARMLPRNRTLWAQAMLHEIDLISDDRVALRWAFGCVFTGYTERIRSIFTAPKPQLATPYAGVKGSDMSAQQLNRISGIAVLTLSLTALLPVAIPFVQMLLGHPPIHSRDEGSAAHIFQLSVCLCGLALLLFLATSDWRKTKAPILRRLAVPIAALALALAFAGVYFMNL